MACLDGDATKAFAFALHADDPIEPPGCSGRAAGLLVQLAGGGSQLTHLAGGKNAPSGGRCAHQNFNHRLKCNWIRVVAIVDHGKPCVVAQHASTHSSRLEVTKNSLRL